ncbi:MAG: transketolase [Synergistaceae bacterium]|jgi:transketolase|nr:transketolase [Synergistaceae bacterium]
MNNIFDEARVKTMADMMRRNILDMAYGCGSGAHLGGGLSVVETLAVLYGAIMYFDPSNPADPDRDRFILSKGHGVLGFYAALAQAGIFPIELLETFQRNGTDLASLTVMNINLGIESSNGSLGQGLSMAAGIALHAKSREKTFRTYVLLGNGECNEGEVWEAVMSASQFKLDNLTAIVDDNSMQSDGTSERIIDMSSFSEKFEAFGWDTASADGHDVSSLYCAITQRTANGRPKAVIAKTVKGKGVSFIENNRDWHHNRLTKSLYEQALAEIGASR